MYGRESLTPNDVQSILHSRALQNKLELKIESREGVFVRGRSKKYNPKKKSNKERSKSREK